MGRRHHEGAPLTDVLKDRHHLLWPRRLYTTQFERHFRCQEGLVVPTLVSAHKDLHLALSPPPKPSRAEMIGLTTSLGAVPNEARENPLWGLVAVYEYYHSINSERSREMMENMARQIGFLSLKEAA